MSIDVRIVGGPSLGGSPFVRPAAPRYVGYFDGVDGFSGGGAAPGEASGAIAPAAMGKQEALKKFTVDLTEQARSGKMDPIVGRDDEMIKSAGNRISPAEIEEAVVTGGEAREAVAIGVPDERLGQAIVIVAAGDSAGEERLRARLRRELRKALTVRLGLRDSDVQGVFTLMRSDPEVSLNGMLQSPAP